MIPFLRKENLDKHQAMKNLEKENQALRRQLKEKDDEIAHLQGQFMDSISIQFPPHFSAERFHLNSNCTQVSVEIFHLNSHNFHFSHHRLPVPVYN